MGASPQFNLSQHKITASSDLTFIALQGTEGIGNTYLTKLTYQQCCEYLQIENEDIQELERLQRDADKPRVHGIRDYLVERENTVFPSLCLVVANGTMVKAIPNVDCLNGATATYVTVPATTDRLLIDGQGRKSGIELAMAIKEHIKNHHIDVKVLIVDTNTVKESEVKVRQIFSDYHFKLKKPTPSQSIYFDNEQKINIFSKELVKVTTAMGVPFSDAVATQKIKHGQLFNFANVADFVSIFIGSSKSEVNDLFKDQDKYDYYLMEIARYIVELYKHLPFEAIQSIGQKKEWKAQLDNNVSCCAIGFKALAYLGNALLDDATVNAADGDDIEFDAAPLAKLSALPLDNRHDELWIKQKIYQNIESKLTIIKGSEQRLARVMCSTLRLPLSKSLV